MVVMKRSKVANATGKSAKKNEVPSDDEDIVDSGLILTIIIILVFGVDNLFVTCDQ